MLKTLLQTYGNRIAKISTGLLFWSVFILLSVTAYTFMERKEHELVELPTPNTGSLVRYDNHLDPANYDVVRFANTTDQHIYIRVNVLPTKKPHLTLFIRQGQAIRLHLPFDNYQIQVAKGQSWFGEWDEALFGKDTKRYELANPLELKRSQRNKPKNLNIQEAIETKTLKTVHKF